MSFFTDARRHSAGLQATNTLTGFGRSLSVKEEVAAGGWRRRSGETGSDLATLGVLGGWAGLVNKLVKGTEY